LGFGLGFGCDEVALTSFHTSFGLRKASVPMRKEYIALRYSDQTV